MKKSKGKDYKWNLNKEFRCRDCNEAILNCRDLLWEREVGSGIMERLYICHTCQRVWLFRGHRYTAWELVYTESGKTAVKAADIF